MKKKEVLDVMMVYIKQKNSMDKNLLSNEVVARISRMVKEKENIAVIMLKLGDKLLKKDFILAKKLIKKGMEYFEKLGSSIDIWGLFNLALANEKIKCFKKAVEYYLKCLELMHEDEVMYSAIKAMMIRTKAKAEADNNKKSALRNFCEAKKFFENAYKLEKIEWRKKKWSESVEEITKICEELERIIYELQ